MADYRDVLYEVGENAVRITINRPEVRNALHSYAYAELRACWRDIGLDPNIYCGIFTGEGDRAFCGGRDVKFLAAMCAFLGASSIAWILPVSSLVGSVLGLALILW